MIVHELLTLFPDPETLRARCRAFAVLDACVADSAPVYDFQAEWAPGVDLATIENGAGDIARVVFEPAGVFLYGFAPKAGASTWQDDGSRMHWPGLLVGLPDSLAKWTVEPTFLFLDFFDATVCAWREAGDTAWRCGPVDFSELPDDPDDPDNVIGPDGADFLFGYLVDGAVESFLIHADAFYDCEPDAEAVRAVLDGEVLTPEIVAALNPAASFSAVAKTAAAAGYPVADAW